MGVADDGLLVLIQDNYADLLSCLGCGARIVGQLAVMCCPWTLADMHASIFAAGLLSHGYCYASSSTVSLDDTGGAVVKVTRTPGKSKSLAKR